MLSVHYPRLVQGSRKLRLHIVEGCVLYSLACDEHDIPTWERSAHLIANAPQTTLSSVAPYGTTELFPCNKSNTTLAVVLICVA